SVAIERYLTEFAETRPPVRQPHEPAAQAIPPHAAAGPARLVGVAVANTAGQACRTFRHGQQMVVETFYAADRGSAGVACEIRLTDASGVIVWASPIDASVAVDTLAGRTYVDRLEVTLNLGPGRYFLSSALWILGGEADSTSAFQ